MGDPGVSPRTSSGPRARSVAAWGVLDQVVSSGANFVFIVAVARTVSPSQFGSVALAFEVYLLTVIVARGVAGDTLLARFSGRDAPVVRAAVRASSGLSLVVAAIAAAGSAFAAMCFDSHLRGVLVALALVLPFLGLQDFVRQGLIVQGRARAAFFNDLAWAVLQLPALSVAILFTPTAPALLAAWGGAGAVAAVIGVAQLGAGLPQVRGTRAWLREHRGLWPYLLGENLLYAAGSFVVVLTVSAVTGLAGLAAFRTAMTVYAPLATLGRGVMSVAVNLLARRRSEPRWIERAALRLSLLMAPAAFVWGALVSLLPDAVGEAGFGESWAGAEPLLILASFPCAVALFAVGTSCGMRALDAGRYGFGARAAVSLVALAAFAVGVHTGGVRGAFEVFAWSTPLQLLIWWRLLAGAARRAERTVMAQTAAITPGSGDSFDVQ